MSAVRADRLETLLEIDRHARSRGGDVAVRCLTSPAEARPQMRFAELAASTAAAADRLRRELDPGSVVMLCIGNGCEYVATLLGVLAAGMRVFPVSPDLPEPERGELAARSGAARIVTGDDAIELTDPGSRRMPPLASFDHRGASLYLESSGTTGRPKIVHRSLASLNAVARNVALATRLGPDDRLLAVIPMCHSYGVENAVLGPLRSGAELIVGCGFDAVAVHDALERAVTVFPAVPFMLQTLAEMSLVRRLPELRLVYSAGSRMPPEVSAVFAQMSGAAVGQLYGSTEVGSVTFDHPADPGFDPRTVGRPLPGVRIRIVDGQVAIAAPSMLEGYVDTDEPAIRDGFFMTGDQGRLGDDGRLWITGRLKLQIDVAGRKVNPLEVEEILMRHPDVRECVVVPLPLTETVNRLKAIIVAEPGATPDVETLRDLARRQLAPHKIPRLFEFRSGLQRTAAGKIIRAALTLLLYVVVVAGCRQRLPTYQWTGPEDALLLMEQRNDAIRDVSARCTVTLADASGSVARLDGELVARRDGPFRIRLHKLSRPVLDVTVTDEGLWLYAAPELKREREDAAVDQARALTDPWSRLWGTDLHEAEVDSVGPRSFFVVERDDVAGRMLRITIDRQTLTPRAHLVIDEAGDERETLELADYRAFGTLVWPTRIVASSEGRTIVLDLHDIQLNGGIDDAAFRPSSRAQRVP